MQPGELSLSPPNPTVIIHSAFALIWLPCVTAEKQSATSGQPKKTGPHSRDLGSQDLRDYGIQRNTVFNIMLLMGEAADAANLSGNWFPVQLLVCSWRCDGDAAFAAQM